MRVAVIQYAPVRGEVEPNVEFIMAAMATASSAGADLAVAPEMSLTGWTLRDPTARRRLAREVAESALPALGAEAVARGLAVIVGGPCHLSEDSNGQLANAAILLGTDGSRAVYAKIHLFGEERAWWTPGCTPTVGTVGDRRVGITICYDAEFPEIPRLTRLAGAEVIAIPTTNMTPYEHDQDVIFATRAIENECPVIVANRVGREYDWTYFGRSLVLDSRGRVVAQAGGDVELLIADVEPSGLDADLSYLTRRRPDVYGGIARTTSTDPTDRDRGVTRQGGT
jgi:predicted amidohydrolase